MTGIYESFGNVVVFIPYAQENTTLEVTTSKTTVSKDGDFQTENTSSNRITNFKETVSNIVSSVSQQFIESTKQFRPDETEIELSLSLSKEGWLFGLQGEGSVKLKMVWKKS